MVSLWGSHKTYFGIQKPHFPLDFKSIAQQALDLTTLSFGLSIAQEALLTWQTWDSQGPIRSLGLPQRALPQLLPRVDHARGLPPGAAPGGGGGGCGACGRSPGWDAERRLATRRGGAGNFWEIWEVWDVDLWDFSQCLGGLGCLGFWFLLSIFEWTC